MPRKKTMLIMAAAIAAVGASAVAVYLALQSSPPGSSPLFSNDASILDRPTLETLPKQDASTANVQRISEDILPPTNSWISGMVLQSSPLAVYSLPLSFQASDTGFTAGLPTVTSAATTITGGHTPDIGVTITGAKSFMLTRFDKTSATLTYRDGDTDLGTVTITQGSPYVFYRALRDSSVQFTNVVGAKKDDQSYSVTKGDKKYVFSAHDKASLESDGSSVSATAPKGGLLTLYALPADETDTLKAFAGNEIESVAVTNEAQDDTSRTHFEYKTVNGKPTAVSFLPYQNIVEGKEASISYQSIYGDMKTYTGTNFSTSAPLVSPATELNIKDVSEDEKTKILADLQADSKAISIEPQDTYFAGKQLAKIANMINLAEQLEQKELSAQLQSALRQEFKNRLGEKYFYYDTKLKGVAGKTKAFGSEDFNDHHFHYGYFIYAASILGKYDSSFLDEYKNTVNLLVADIASYETYEEFPIMRTYDPYSAHSWAAGLSPFQDGNNQESSSEALNAWNGVAAWAQLIGNKTLERNAKWMLSNETATAKNAWRNVDTSAEYLTGYKSPVASLSFGGKRTYATFFSDESNTKLGIQLIPMSPVMTVFKEDGDAINAKLAAQDTPGSYNVALGDYLIMYLALHDKAAAMRALDEQKDQFIDDGNSRAYLRAWVYAQ